MRARVWTGASASAACGAVLRAAAVLGALAFGAGMGPAAAQVVDVVGGWTCSIEEYGGEAGAAGRQTVFGLALYRDGRWASNGRYPDGTEHLGEGDWRFGTRREGRSTILVTGITQDAVGLARPFNFDADIIDAARISRTARSEGLTTVIDCGR